MKQIHVTNYNSHRPWLRAMLEGPSGDKWMVQDLMWGDPLPGINMKHCLQQINAFLPLISRHYIQVLQGQLMLDTKSKPALSKLLFKRFKMILTQCVL